MALLICSLLMGLQSVPGIIKPYSKGVVQFRNVMRRGFDLALLLAVFPPRPFCVTSPTCKLQSVQRNFRGAHLYTCG